MPSLLPSRAQTAIPPRLSRSPTAAALAVLFAIATTSAGCQEYAYAELGVIDTYNQVGEAPPADILFVIDDSASMGEEQLLLQDNFAAFVEVLETTYIDFQLGVVSTDPEADPALLGEVLTAETPDLAEAFLEVVSVGTDGSRDEMGLAAALAALNPGNNPGFVRDDANVAVVIFSDEDDHSPDSVDFYTNEIRVTAGDATAAVHAIVGDLPDGCASGVSAADPGERYLRAADATGGLSWSICASDYTEMLTRVAFEIAGWQDTYYLSSLPEIATLEVFVDEVQMPQREEDGWTYSLGDNAVVFHGRAVPRPGMEITITYEIAEGVLSEAVDSGG